MASIRQESASDVHCSDTHEFQEVGQSDQVLKAEITKAEFLFTPAASKHFSNSSTQ